MRIEKLILSVCGTNCYFVYNEESLEGIIIDPADSPERIDEFVKKRGISIKGIFLSHGHFDHIGAAKRLKELYGVLIYAHVMEESLLGDGMLNLSSMFGESMSVKPDRLLGDGHVETMCGFDIKVIHTPGHTEGSCCYLISDNGCEVLFSGDTLFYESHGRTDFPTGSEKKIYDSIIERLLILDGELTVYPGHGEATTIEDEKKWYWRR